MKKTTDFKKVTAGLICSDGKILITQRPKNKMFPLKWEFPGGKIEANEDPEQCLAREIKEELDIDIEVSKPFVTVHYRYPEFHISLMTFWCKIKKGRLRLLEHNDYRWVRPDELRSFVFVDADTILIDKIVREGIPEEVERDK